MCNYSQISSIIEHSSVEQITEKITAIWRKSAENFESRDKSNQCIDELRCNFYAKTKNSQRNYPFDGVLSDYQDFNPYEKVQMYPDLYTYLDLSMDATLVVFARLKKVAGKSISLERKYYSKK